MYTGLLKKLLNELLRIIFNTKTFYISKPGLLVRGLKIKTGIDKTILTLEFTYF